MTCGPLPMNLPWLKAQLMMIDEDLMIHTLNQLGDEYKTIVATLKVQDAPISYSELYDKLVDFERFL